MSNITILDPQYKEWVKELSLRYRKSQIKAAVKVNSEMLRFYWSLGFDIVNRKAESLWGSKFYKTLSADLKNEMPDATCFSETNLKYMKYFYEMFPVSSISPQIGDKLQTSEISPQVGDELQVAQISPQVGDELQLQIFSIPWGHIKLLIDKYKTQQNKALFFIHKIVSEGWSRDMLLNFISTDLYEREGKAPNNFNATLPAPMSDLAK